MKDRFTQKKDSKITDTRDPADIIAQKQHAALTITANTEGLENKHRVSLNLPKDKYEIVKRKAKSRGLTLTAYIIILINEDIENV
jgi:predicted DNA binding CopG/RHH family protein